MANIWDQIKSFVPGIQQIFQNAGYNQQQGNRSAISGLLPRSLGGTGLVAPAYASDTVNPIQGGGGGGGGAGGAGGSGDVLGATTTNTGGGGDTRKQQLEKMNRNPKEEEEYQSYLEQAPAQPQINYDEIFAPAFEALSQQEAASQSAFQADTASIEQGTAQRKQGLMSEQESRMQDFNQQGQEATQTNESIIQAARRQANELLQGIQAIYGGTTGTGKFQSEILGAQATQNIAMQQQAFQNTMGKITQAANNLKTKVTELINNEDQQLETQKLQLRSQLQQALADVGKERGRLESEKAQMRIDTMRQYQDVLAGINQRNTAFKQQLFMQAQEAQTQLELLQAKAQENYKVAQAFDPGSLKQFSVGATPYAAAPTSSGGYQFLKGEADPLQGLQGSITTGNPEDQLNQALGL